MVVPASVSCQRLGRDALYASTVIRLPLEKSEPETKRKKSKTQTAQTAGNCDLLTVLTALRNKIAEAENVPRYQILNNAVLEELARIMPETIEEASGISGVGPVKLRRIVPAMLEAIRLWKISRS